MLNEGEKEWLFSPFLCRILATVNIFLFPPENAELKK